jgi:hypothetical protein
MTDFMRLGEVPGLLGLPVIAGEARAEKAELEELAAQLEAAVDGRLCRELAELREMYRRVNAEKHELQRQLSLREAAAEALREVLWLFVTDSSGMWARSVHVSPQDLDGWRAAERAARR